MNLVVQDVTELTKLLTTGGGSQVTMERLERSIAQLREMFTTRYTYQIYNPFTIREKKFAPIYFYSNSAKNPKTLVIRVS